MNGNTTPKIRIALLVTWIVLLLALLAFIRYADVNTAVQGLATILVKAYLWGSIVVIAILEWLRRKKPSR